MIHIKLLGTEENLPEVVKALAGFHIVDISTSYTKNEQTKKDDDPVAKARRSVDILRRRAHGLDTPPPIG